jgi:RimJ/RimL family protein N-acetyltransferase
MNIPFLNLNLRMLAGTDSAQLLELIDRNRPRLLNYFPMTAASITNLTSSFTFVNEKLELAKKKNHFVMLIENEEKQLRGLFFLKNIDWGVPKAELAYFIDKDLEGKGVMTKALCEVVNYGFYTLGMNRLYIITGVDNHASRKIAEKNGFEVEGILRRNFRIASGELVDNVGCISNCRGLGGDNEVAFC